MSIADADTQVEDAGQASTATKPPAEIGDRYTLATTLGRGGMGEVVLARDHQIDREVAIKRMHADAPSPDAVARFLREARIQGKLEHPAIVPVHEVARDDAGRPYFVMKRLAGTTLADAIRAGKLARTAMLRAFVDVCLACELAHSKGIIHRDLKPANVMLGDFGEVYVLDWGIARVLGEAAQREGYADPSAPVDGVTVEGSVLGTPGYMSPEQLHGAADLDARSDVYALGCILFEILAGEPLHAGKDAIASTLAARDAHPSARGREIPPELDEACATACAFERDQRIASARALGDTIQRFLDGDRDLAARRELAVRRFADAQAAFERGASPADRAAAMKAAGAALALDPTLPGPAELVGRLMIEPPAHAPPEVERELLAQDLHAISSQGRLLIVSLLSYVGFLPVIYAIGFRAGWAFALMGGVLAANLLGLLAHRRGLWFANGMMIGHAAIVLVFARIGTPFLVAPCLGGVMVMVMAMHPRVWPGWVCWAVPCAAVLLPMAMAALGVWESTVVVSGENVSLHLPSDGPLDSGLTKVLLSGVILSVFAVGAILARMLANQQRAGARALQIQAWQLRQLV